MLRFYGAPSVFATWSFDDAHEPLVLRLCLRSAANVGFPATDTRRGFSFADSLHRGDATFPPPPEEGTVDDDELAGVIRIPIDAASMERLAACSPDATAAVFKCMSEAVCEKLMRIPLSQHTASTQRLDDRSRGIFGKLLAMYGVVENNSRDALHAHFICWSSLSPRVLTAAASVPAVQEVVRKCMDSMFAAEVRLCVINNLQCHHSL
jgi:hypothetical protein